MGFRINSLPIRVILPLPTEEQFEYTTHKDPQKRQNAYNQAERQAWRSLVHVLKAKLEAITASITTIEDEFHANIILPNNSTIGANLLPRLQDAITTGRLPPMLPDPPQ